MHLIFSLSFQELHNRDGISVINSSNRSLSSKEQANKATEHESKTIEQRKHDIANRKPSFVLSFRNVQFHSLDDSAMFSRPKVMIFFRYLDEQSYFLKKKSPQSHQPSWRVMLWKLQFNSESVSERIAQL